MKKLPVVQFGLSDEEIKEKKLIRVDEAIKTMGRRDRRKLLRHVAKAQMKAMLDKKKEDN